VNADTGRAGAIAVGRHRTVGRVRGRAAQLGQRRGWQPSGPGRPARGSDRPV